MNKNLLFFVVSLLVAVSCQSPTNKDGTETGGDNLAHQTIDLTVDLPAVLLPASTPTASGDGGDYVPKGFDAYSKVLTNLRERNRWAATYAILAKRILDESGLQPGEESEGPVTVTVTQTDVDDMLATLPSGLLTASGLPDVGESLTFPKAARWNDEDSLHFEEGDTVVDFDEALEITIGAPEDETSVWLNWNHDLQLFVVIVYTPDYDFAAFYDHATSSATFYTEGEDDGTPYLEILSYLTTESGTAFYFEEWNYEDQLGTMGKGIADANGISLISTATTGETQVLTREGVDAAGQVVYQAHQSEGDWAADFGTADADQEDALNEVQPWDNGDWGLSWTLIDWI